jgi:hypothetical protein
MSDLSFFSRKKAFNSEQLTVSSSVVTLTASEYDNTSAGVAQPGREAPHAGGFKASAAVIECQDDDVYFTLDGSTPSSTNGRRLTASSSLPLAGYQKIANFKAIRVTGDATLNVEYFKE